jgi:hypothetical protein
MLQKHCKTINSIIVIITQIINFIFNLTKKSTTNNYIIFVELKGIFTAHHEYALIRFIINIIVTSYYFYFCIKNNNHHFRDMPTLRTHVQVVMALFGSRESGLASYKGIIFP